jgi:hypothetical protein
MQGRNRVVLEIKLNFVNFGLYRIWSDGYYYGLSINEIEVVRSI